MPSDPWGISGPEFTGLFVVAFVVAVLLIFGVRRLLTRLGSAGDQEKLQIGPYQAAYLAGGSKRAIDAAVTALALAGRVHATRGGKLTRTRNTATGSVDAFEEAVHGTLLPRAKRKQQIAALRRHPAMRGLVNDLRRQRLLLGPGRTALARWVLLLPFAVWVVGLVRAINGAQLDRPVSNLITLLVFSGIALIVLAFLARGPECWPSPRGRSALRRLRGRYQATRPTGKAARTRTAAANTTAVLGVAVLGLTELPHTSLRNSLLASGVSSTGGSSGGSGGGSSCSSGSSCGGGGGCGGGGCGG